MLFILCSQEPLYLTIYGFHAKNKMVTDLEKYILAGETLPTFPTDYCRYVFNSHCNNYSLMDLTGSFR